MSAPITEAVAWIDNQGQLVALEGVRSGGFVGHGRAIPDDWTPLVPRSALTARDNAIAAILPMFDNDGPLLTVYAKEIAALQALAQGETK